MERQLDYTDIQSGEVFELSRKALLKPKSQLLKELPPLLQGALKFMAQHPPIKSFALISGEDGGYLKVIHEPSEVAIESHGVYEASRGLAQLNMRMLDSAIEWENMNGRSLDEVEGVISQEASHNPQVSTYVFYHLID